MPTSMPSLDPVTLAEVRAWLASQDPETIINMKSSCGCLGAQLMKARGFAGVDWGWNGGDVYAYACDVDEESCSSEDLLGQVRVEEALWGAFEGVWYHASQEWAARADYLYRAGQGMSVITMQPPYGYVSIADIRRFFDAHYPEASKESPDGQATQADPA